MAGPAAHFCPKVCLWQVRRAHGRPMEDLHGWRLCAERLVGVPCLCSVPALLPPLQHLLLPDLDRRQQPVPPRTQLPLDEADADGLLDGLQLNPLLQWQLGRGRRFSRPRRQGRRLVQLARERRALQALPALRYPVADLAEARGALPPPALHHHDPVEQGLEGNEAAPRHLPAGEARMDGAGTDPRLPDAEPVSAHVGEQPEARHGFLVLHHRVYEHRLENEVARLPGSLGAPLGLLLDVLHALVGRHPADLHLLMHLPRKGRDCVERQPLLREGRAPRGLLGGFLALSDRLLALLALPPKVLGVLLAQRGHHLLASAGRRYEAGAELLLPEGEVLSARRRGRALDDLRRRVPPYDGLVGDLFADLRKRGQGGQRRQLSLDLPHHLVGVQALSKSLVPLLILLRDVGSLS
mmetsp:Transcript_85592/g.277208  ORF Transcript_85592/g.277208 Transcript_85592/m.277208 type:complete len:410 (-) Transcript_85592:733-1962(-)